MGLRASRMQQELMDLAIGPVGTAGEVQGTAE